MYRLLACWNFGQMNVSLISMKNMIFLLGNPPSKCPKCQKFSRLRRAQGVAYYFENLRIWNSNVSLISFPKIGPNVNVSLIEGGGVYCQLGGRIRDFTNPEMCLEFCVCAPGTPNQCVVSLPWNPAAGYRLRQKTHSFGMGFSDSIMSSKTWRCSFLSRYIKNI